MCGVEFEIIEIVQIFFIKIVNNLIQECDKMYIFPLKYSKVKDKNIISTPEQRMDMCKLAFKTISSNIQSNILLDSGTLLTSHSSTLLNKSDMNPIPVFMAFQAQSLCL